MGVKLLALPRYGSKTTPTRCAATGTFGWSGRATSPPPYPPRSCAARLEAAAANAPTVPGHEAHHEEPDRPPRLLSDGRANRQRRRHSRTHQPDTPYDTPPSPTQSKPAYRCAMPRSTSATPTHELPSTTTAPRQPRPRRRPLRHLVRRENDSMRRIPPRPGRPDLLVMHVIQVFADPRPFAAIDAVA